MAIPLVVTNPHSSPQCGDLMQVSLPFAPGHCPADRQLVLRDGDGQTMPSQGRVLGRWPDGSLRWVVLRWPGRLAAQHSETYQVEVADGAVGDTRAAIATVGADGAVELDTGAVRLSLGTDPARFLTRVGIPGSLDASWVEWDPQVAGGQLFATVGGTSLTPRFTRAVEVLDNGPVCAELYYRGAFEDAEGTDVLRFRLRLVASRDSQQLRLSLTLHNPRHQPREELGHFRLGLPGAALIDDAGLRLALRGPGIPWTMIAGQRGASDHLGPLYERATIHQDSSGTERWFHRSHVTRDWRYPQQFRGYRMQVDGTQAYTGDHAGGWAAVADQRNCIAIGVEKFWQNFPQVLRCERGGDASTITAALFPSEARFPHEMVGGEQKTHHLVLSFNRIDKRIDQVHDNPPNPSPQIGYASLKAKMEALLERPVYLPPAQQLIDAGVVQPTEAYDPERFGPYEMAVDGIFEDPTFTLFDLRDAWDHYGWRHFGDFNADYEGGGDLLSHHNNEYDYSRGLLLQAIRRHERNPVSAGKFVEAGLWAAIHQADIDIYHTDEDPHGGGCYNGGKFTHTDHLIEPGRSGHRQSDSLAFFGDLDWPWGRGGGPESGHYDNEGMMLAHYLTGDPVLAESALEVADNVVHKVMNDVHAQHDYYRTSGHNMSCCLTGYFHTWDQRYVDAIDAILAATTPDRVQTDRERDADGLFSAGSYFNGNYLKPVLMYIEQSRRLFGRTPDLAWSNLQTYCDCMHRYNYDEEQGLFATVPAADPSTQSFPLHAGGGASWFHVDAFCWAAMLREDEAQRDRELIRAFRHYLRITASACPDGRPVYRNNKTFTYTVNNGHSVLRAIARFPALYEQARRLDQARA